MIDNLTAPRAGKFSAHFHSSIQIDVGIWLSGRSNRNRNARSRGVEAIELDRSSIARLLEKLREEDHKAAVEAANAVIDSDERPKRSYDRRHRVERNRRSQSERHDGNEIELDCLLSSKNSNRSDRSRKSDSRRSRSKQETIVNDDVS